MVWNKRRYTWYYNNIQSHLFDVGARLWFLPLGGEAAVRRSLVAAAGLQGDGRVLDMCCGTGGTTFIIRERLGAAADVTGIDLSVGQLRRAVHRNRCSNVRFLAMDAGFTGFKDGSFDSVVIPHALHEMPRQERVKVLGEARRLAIDGGSVVVLEMDRPQNLLWRLLLGLWWFYWLPFNFETPTRRDMMRHGVAGELAEAGFTQVTKQSLHHGALQVVTGRKPRGGRAVPVSR